MWSLTESLMELLWDKDTEIVEMTLITLTFLCLHKHILLPNPIVSQLAEALLPFFVKVRLCAPAHGPWVLLGNLVPYGFQGEC